MNWFGKSQLEKDVTHQAARIIEEASRLQNSKDALKSALDSLQLRYDEADGPDGNVIAFPMTEKTLGTIMVIAILDADGESLQFKFELRNSVPDEKLPKLYEILNKCNASYRWVKTFIVTDRDNKLMMDCDVAWDTVASKKTILEAFMRSVAVATKIYPMVMRGIWDTAF